MKASDLFVRSLEEEGVEYIFGIPGEETLDLLESLRRSKIKLILTRHEQAAGFMAATYGRLTGKAGVCLSTLGPGATNLVTPVAYCQLEVIGDIANTVWQIKEKITVPDHWDFSYFNMVKESFEKHLLEGISDERFPIHPQRLVSDVRKAMPDDGILALDNGIYKIWFARNYKAMQPNTVLLDNALATMGAGVPSAMSARLVFPGKTILAIWGDGWFMMNSQELETAVRLEMDLIVLILRDDAYGMIKWKQANMNFDNFGLDYGNPDFVKYAESYGAKGYRVKAVDDLIQPLRKCQQERGIHLIDLPVDYS